MTRCSSGPRKLSGSANTEAGRLLSVAEDFPPSRLDSERLEARLVGGLHGAADRWPRADNLGPRTTPVPPAPGAMHRRAIVFRTGTVEILMVVTGRWWGVQIPAKSSIAPGEKPRR
jgi:hypothetical protein